jgi:hypothetical protein
MIYPAIVVDNSSTRPSRNQSLTAPAPSFRPSAPAEGGAAPAVSPAEARVNAEDARPSIEDYCGLVLNSERYFRSILKGEKIYEVRTIRRSQLPPRIVLHPSRSVRDGGYTQNIEAKIAPFQHEIPLWTVEELLAATNDGLQLGLDAKETRAFVAASNKSSDTRFYLYILSEPRESEIEWLDAPAYNQAVFSAHQYGNPPRTLFRWPPPAAVQVRILPLHASPCVDADADELCCTGSSPVAPVPSATFQPYRLEATAPTGAVSLPVKPPQRSPCSAAAGHA